MRVVAGILVGGLSRRMGRPKALIRIAGETLLERTVWTAADAADEVVLVGQPPFDLPASLSHLPRIDDHVAGIGPIGGLAGLRRARPDDAALLVACDLPGLTSELLHCLRVAAAESKSCSDSQIKRSAASLSQHRSAGGGTGIQVPTESIRTGQRPVPRDPRADSQVLGDRMGTDPRNIAGVEAVVFATGPPPNGWQPCCGLYLPSIDALLFEQVQAGRLALIDLLSIARVLTIPLDQDQWWMLHNVNNGNDLESFAQAGDDPA